MQYDGRLSQTRLSEMSTTLSIDDYYYCSQQPTPEKQKRLCPSVGGFVVVVVIIIGGFPPTQSQKADSIRIRDQARIGSRFIISR